MDCGIQKFQIALQRNVSDQCIAKIHLTGHVANREPCRIEVRFCHILPGFGTYSKFGPNHLVKVNVPVEEYERYIELLESERPLTASWDAAPGSMQLSWFELTS